MLSSLYTRFAYAFLPYYTSYGLHLELRKLSPQEIKSRAHSCTVNKATEPGFKQGWIRNMSSSTPPSRSAQARVKLTEPMISFVLCECLPSPAPCQQFQDEDWGYSSGSPAMNDTAGTLYLLNKHFANRSATLPLGPLFYPCTSLERIQR